MNGQNRYLPFVGLLLIVYGVFLRQRCSVE